MTHPPPRHIFNADGDTWFTRYPRQSALYRAADRLTKDDIHHYVGVLADAGINTLALHAADRKAYYPSKNVPTILDGYRRGDRSFFYGAILGWEMTSEQIEKYLADATYRMDGYLDLVEAGVDWMAESVAAARGRGVAPWASVRMNDMHGNPKYQQGYSMHPPIFKDPAMRLRGVTQNPAAPMQESWRGFNYARREVRDFMLAILRDAVESYDFDGLELDWSRWPLCCEPDEAERVTDTITAWHGEVREMAERRAKATGRPFTLGVRYFGTLDQMKSIGLDFRAMAQRGILDWVGPTNAWQSSWDIPLDEIKRELGGVAVYGVLEFSPNFVHGWLPHQARGNPNLGAKEAVNYRLSPACPPILRGNAAAKLVLGAEGIEVYNFACGEQAGHWPWPEEPYRAEYAALRGLDDLESLRGKPKLYTFSSQVGYYAHALFEGVSPFPLTLGPGERRAVKMPMAAERAGSGLELVVQVIVKTQDPPPPIGVYFNGCWPNFSPARDERLLFPVATMTHHAPGQVGLNYPFPIGAIREGWNEIVVMHGTEKNFWADQSKEPVRIEMVEAGVREWAG